LGTLRSPTRSPKHGLHIGGETVGQVLREAASGFAFFLEPVMDGEKMKRQDEKAALKRVGNPKGLIENRKPRLRHNRAIEFRCVRWIWCFEGGEGVQRTVRLV
jgi:hypothetical protein